MSNDDTSGTVEILPKEAETDASTEVDESVIATTADITKGETMEEGIGYIGPPYHEREQPADSVPMEVSDVVDALFKFHSLKVSEIAKNEGLDVNSMVDRKIIRNFSACYWFGFKIFGSNYYGSSFFELQSRNSNNTILMMNSGYNVGATPYSDPGTLTELMESDHHKSPIVSFSTFSKIACSHLGDVRREIEKRLGEGNKTKEGAYLVNGLLIKIGPDKREFSMNCLSEKGYSEIRLQRF